MNAARQLIAVDIGNSSTKLGWFQQVAAPRGLPVPIDVAEFRTGELPDAALLARLPAQACSWRVASVQRDGQRKLEGWVRSQRPHDDLQVLTYRDLPLQVAVDFPERVGMDRLAAVVAANVLREAGRPAIVVDAGSAVTVDLVGEHGSFEGGVIMAGFHMQAESLFGSADLLPLALLKPSDEPPPVLGKNTEAAIRSGLFWGAVGAVREIIERMSADLGTQPQIFVTGGDLRRLAQWIGSQAQFVPHLVLAGICVSEQSRRASKSR